MTIRDFFTTVWESKFLVAVALVATLAGAYLYLDRQPVTYEAQAYVQLTLADPVPGTDTRLTVDGDPDVVRSAGVLEPAAQALGADPADLARAISATPTEEQGMIAISARAGSEQQAVQTVDAVAAAYVEHLGGVLDGQLGQIDERLEGLRDRYADVAKTERRDPLAPTELAAIEGQYEALLVERTMLDSIRSSSAAASVVQPATGAASLSASWGSVLALAALGGLLAGVGLAFARRGLDFRVRTAADAVELAGVPVLAELFGVPRAVKDAQAANALPVASRTASPFTESIRELRTALHVTLEGRDHAVVLVTAADPAAPRSFIASNLAVSWALSGRRTVILEGDMRRPKLDTLLPPPDGWTGDPHGPRPTRVPNLEVVRVPYVEMDPADYLATDEAQALVHDLRTRAEVVVVDAPPVLAAADATILGAYSDTAVLLATAGKTDRVVLSESAGRLQGNNVPLAGIAFSGVKGDRRTLYASVYDAGEDATPVAPATQAAATTPAPPAETAPPSEAGVPVGAAAPATAATAARAARAARAVPPVTATDPVEHRPGRPEPATAAAARTAAARRRTPQWHRVPQADRRTGPVPASDGDPGAGVRRR